MATDDDKAGDVLDKHMRSKVLQMMPPLGRGAFHGGQSGTGRSRGRHGSENAGMSSETDGENPSHRKPKGSRATLVVPG